MSHVQTYSSKDCSILQGLHRWYVRPISTLKYQESAIFAGTFTGVSDICKHIKNICNSHHEYKSRTIENSSNWNFH